MLDDIKEGSIDLAGDTIDLEELDDAYDKDLDTDDSDENNTSQEPQADGMAAPAPAQQLPAM